MLNALRIPSGEGVLYATLHEPEGARRHDLCALFLAGPATNRAGPGRLHYHVASALVRRGIHAVRFDYRGRGESTGDEQIVGIPTMIEDTLAVSAALRRIVGPDAGLHLVANCLGSVAALRVLELAPDIEGAVLLGAPHFLEQQDRAHFTAELVHASSQYWKKLASLETWRRVLGGNIRYREIGEALLNTAARRYRSRLRVGEQRRYGEASALRDKDVRLLWGERDPSLAERPFYERFCSERRWRYEARVLSAADRSFSRADWAEQVAALVGDWLEDAASRRDAARSPVSL